MVIHQKCGNSLTLIPGEIHDAVMIIPVEAARNESSGFDMAMEYILQATRNLIGLAEFWNFHSPVDNALIGNRHDGLQRTVSESLLYLSKHELIQDLFTIGPQRGLQQFGLTFCLQNRRRHAS